jgi:hypothetical protein
LWSFTRTFLAVNVGIATHQRIFSRGLVLLSLGGEGFGGLSNRGV